MAGAGFHTPSFHFSGKIKFHCIVNDEESGDGVSIASIPGFASSEMCSELISLCELHGFRKESEDSTYVQATVDLEVDSSPIVRAWLLEKQLIPAIARCMRATHSTAPVAFDDMFIVKYDTSSFGGWHQKELKLHFDGGDVSFMLALSPSEAYSGGGTYFDVLRYGKHFVNNDSIIDDTIQLQQGELLLFDAALKHAGRAITTGQRYLLVGFCFTNDASVDVAGNVDLLLNKIL